MGFSTIWDIMRRLSAALEDFLLLGRNEKANLTQIKTHKKAQGKFPLRFYVWC